MSNVPAMIEELRAYFDKVERVDPDGLVYKGVCKILDRADDAALQAAADANIKFVSLLAQNRILKRRLGAGNPA